MVDHVPWFDLGQPIMVKRSEMMVDHAQTMIDHGQTMIDHGRPWSHGKTIARDIDSSARG